MSSRAASITQLEEASVRIGYKGEYLHSGWLFTHQGHILTAGHTIQARMQIGQHASVEFVRHGLFTAELIAVAFSRKDCIDWAVLRITSNLGKLPMPVPITCDWEAYVDSPVILKGFPSEAAYQQSITGKLVGRASNDTGYFLEIDTGVKHDQHGFSGSAICVQTSTGIFAIGLQSSQPGAENIRGSATHKVFGVPIGRATAQVVRDECETLRNAKSIGIKFFGLDKNLFGKSTYQLPENVRWTVLVTPFTTVDPQGSQLCAAISNEWGSFRERVANRTRCIDWVGSNGLAVKLEKTTHLQNGNKPVPWSTILDQLDEDPQSIRAVIDISGTVSSSGCAATRARMNASHVIGVRFADESCCGSDGLFDFLINVGSPSVLKSKERVYTILEDMVLDMFVFHSSPTLRHMYGRGDARAEFSQLKAQYVVERRLTVYGFPASNAARYYSLAACCRASIDSPIDHGKFREIWRDFLNNYLIPLGGQSRYESYHWIQSPAELYEALREASGLFGQISESRLIAKASKFTTNAGEVCAIAFAVRRPKNTKQRDGLRSSLHGSKYRRNMFRILPARDLHEVAVYMQYLRLYLFRCAW